MKLDQSTIIITGGSRGIGAFLATQLSRLTFKIIVIDKDLDSLNQLRDTYGIATYCCDLTDFIAVNKTIGEIFNAHPEVNVLINNAGYIHSEPLFNLLQRDDPKHSLSGWDKTIDINLNAVFYTTVNVVEQFRKYRLKQGLIINISSISAQGNAGQTAYSATKAGIEAMTKTWAKELSMFNIRSNAIAPGFFNTESTRLALSPAMIQKWEQSIPLKRLGELEELLSGVQFIISNDYYNGQVMSINGGLTL